MKTVNFPYIALGLGVPLLLIVLAGSNLGDDGSTRLPLLTLLIVSEFAGVVCAIGAYIGIQQLRSAGIQWLYLLATLLCGLLSAQFLMLGLELWPL